jgi:glycine cleavage system aminomethyltransferase T
MIVVNASNIEKDWDWITKHNNQNAELHNISDKTCLLAIQGPNATKILQALSEMDILNLKYYTFSKGKFAGVDNVLVSATDIPVQAELKFILRIKMIMPIKSGMQSLKRARRRV